MFVTQAVESALSQPETGEVLLIDDNSPDGGIEICKSLAEKYDQVRLLQHSDRMNHGAAASRNLGIVKSSCPFIAFLDADDYYLPNRFAMTAQVFEEHSDADGVYEAIGAFFEDEKASRVFKQVLLRELTTVNKLTSPDLLFEEILFGGIGSFSFDGFTGKRHLFFNVSMFNEKLKYLEDTELVYKLAAKGVLYPGNIKVPIAIRRVHQDNRITSLLADKRQTFTHNCNLWEALVTWAEQSLPPKKQRMVALRFVERLKKSDYFDDHKFIDLVLSRKKMIELLVSYPQLLLNRLFWKYAIPSRSIFRLRAKPVLREY